MAIKKQHLLFAFSLSPCLIPTGTAYWFFREIPLLENHTEYDVARNCTFLAYIAHSHWFYFILFWDLTDDIKKIMHRTFWEIYISNSIIIWLCLKSMVNFVIENCNNVYGFQGSSRKKISSFRGWKRFDWSQFPHSFAYRNKIEDELMKLLLLTPLHDDNKASSYACAFHKI